MEIDDTKKEEIREWVEWAVKLLSIKGAPSSRIQTGKKIAKDLK